MTRLRWHEVPVFIFFFSSEITASFSNPQKNPRLPAATASDRQQERRLQLSVPRLTAVPASGKTLAFRGDLRESWAGEGGAGVQGARGDPSAGTAGGQAARDPGNQRTDEIYSTLRRGAFLSLALLPGFSFLFDHQQPGAEPPGHLLGAAAISALIPGPAPRSSGRRARRGPAQGAGAAAPNVPRAGPAAGHRGNRGPRGPWAAALSSRGGDARPAGARRRGRWAAGPGLWRERRREGRGDPRPAGPPRARGRPEPQRQRGLRDSGSARLAPGPGT